MKPYFEYKLIPTSETSKLLEIEPKLGKYIDFTKPFNIRIMPNHYQCFIHTVISQQLSNAAVDTIWNKLVMYFKKIDPKTISKASHEQLAAVGLSPQKISLIKRMTYDIVDKRIDLDKLATLSNEAIANILINYKYIGK
jgi:DNA-3-methyladenine glycosylase II